MLKSIKCEARLRSVASFSLVELTLALGVAAFCLIAVFGLVPVGVQTNRNATSETAATNILSSVVSDIRASPGNQSQASKKYGILRSKTNITRVCFDGQGGWTKLQGNNTVCPANSRYRLFVKMANNPDSVVYPNYAYLKVTWPAAIDPLANLTIQPSGSVETITAYFVK
jgi:uncharacterized protein (TIGR02598 family)